MPFKCEFCEGIFCKNHFKQKTHNCDGIKPESKNILPRCPLCNELILVPSNMSPDNRVNDHINSGCKLYIINTKKQKSACYLKGCKSNRAPCECKYCKHWFCAQLLRLIFNISKNYITTLIYYIILLIDIDWRMIISAQKEKQVIY